MKCLGLQANTDCRGSAKIENKKDDEDDIYSGFNDDFGNAQGDGLPVDFSCASGSDSLPQGFRLSPSRCKSGLNTVMSRDKCFGTPKSHVTTGMGRLTSTQGAGFTRRSSVDEGRSLSGKSKGSRITAATSYVSASSLIQTSRISALNTPTGTNRNSGLLLTPQDKARCIEKTVNQLLNESYCANDCGYFMVALDKAKVW